MKQLEHKRRVLPWNTKIPSITRHESFWVFLGYLFWFGFFLGAMIVRAMTK